MKKYIRSILSISICLALIDGFTSCDMDVSPTKDTDANAFWKTDKDAWMALNGIYSELTPGAGVYDDTYTDEVYCQYSWESNGPIFVRDGLSAATGPGWDFVGIRRVNDFLENVGKCTMDDNIKERMKAEARFLRAINYLDKTLIFGKAPVITTALNPDEKNIKRDPVEEVRKFVIDELSAVSKILPASYTGGYLREKGRVTSYAALAYLSRAALLFGDYQLAESTAKQLMNGTFSLFKVTSLTPEQEKEAEEMDQYIDFTTLGINKDKYVKGMFSYETLWHTENANPDNPEYIFSRQYAEKIQENWVAYLTLRPNQLGGWSSATPTQNLVNIYWTADGKNPALLSNEDRGRAFKKINDDFLASGKSFSEFCAAKVADGTIKNYDFIKELRNRDSRLYASVMLPFKGWFETVQGGNDFYYRWWNKNIPGNESLSGYNFRKMTPLDRSTSGEDEATGDFPCFRFAEVLLIFAEARTHNTGCDSQVQAVLNQIRDRCGMPDVPASLTKDQAITLIRNERRIELAGEGARATDLTRYEDSYWQTMMNNVPITRPDGEIILTMKWSSRMRLRPLPQGALDRNPVLSSDQNPGY
ncbi:RagB/SusD family nutrient uptake outer membrane protein [Dysgonomonas sp. GY75]|uniref:RagB/SusD family nutrient uptake outer membrane protein n=1 Tax=Dysgonomonas sp. GY75 TaxID=2780419 RepID=UPI0018848F90|nr:RagB/SusD family nutrient uptake outer membrane protein [Dysgonomonas sp. GY75]MBF0647397.1 RagB/SusD family nutrient uptake outer membrane protein [Dysgonomonas sp. GY75]